jgi:homocitrate synthase
MCPVPDGEANGHTNGETNGVANGTNGDHAGYR